MTIYGDLEEKFFREFNSSTKESLEDIGLDEEEKNKIIFNISGSETAAIPKLRVDYSDFKNHIFFGSAWSATSFALRRLLDYPLDGELKDVNSWKDLNTGYENWFFDNFPKDTGHIFLTSGSASDPSIIVTDYENKVNFGTGSFTIESIFKSYENLGANQNYPIASIWNGPTGGTGSTVYLYLSASVKKLSFTLAQGNSASVELVYDSYISGVHAVACAASRQDNGTYLGKIYVDGELKTSGTFDTSIITGSNFDIGNKKIRVGYSNVQNSNSNFTGSIDEVRIWGSERPSTLIKRNYNRTIYANHSSSLQLYYKFNEPWLTSSNKVIDYSGNDLEGSFSGTYDTSVNFVSGPLGSLVDSGDLLLDLTNDRVDSFITEQKNSGSLYDKENTNYIFELIPSWMVDEENSEMTQNFLLLIARHWDRIKLYIQHLSNIYLTSPASFEDTPSDLLNFAAKHYGIDIGGIYEGSNPLQYFFGEDVIESGSFDSSIETVRNQIKRNVLNNLIYLYKSKSTKEAIKAALRTLGLDDEVVNVNQYSIFSGGLKTSYEPKVAERRTLRFDGTDGQYIALHSSSYNDAAPRSYQFRVHLTSGSYTGSAAPMTSSIFRIEENNSGSMIMNAEIRRENISSSLGQIYVFHSSALTSSISSSFVEMYNNNWVNFTLFRQVPAAQSKYGYSISSINVDEIKFHLSGVGTLGASAYNPSPTSSIQVKIGATVEEPTYSLVQEARVWNNSLTSSGVIERHTKDFESLSLESDSNFDELLIHLKLNDKTGSASGIGMLHDYVDNKSGSTYVGFSSSGEYNFPGAFVPRMEPSYTYDFNIDNEKVRIKDDDSVFTSADINQDVQFMSIDFSPVAALNKEIIKWFGDIEKFNNIIGYPYLKYRDEITELNGYRNKFFSSRMSADGVDFDSYLKIIKWFDSNFTYFLSQLIPLDIASSLSNFVIEPHILEYNKVKNIFPYSDESFSRTLEGSVTVTPSITAESAISVLLGDAGRFGAFGSASAKVENDAIINYSGSLTASSNVNDRNYFARKIISDYLSGGTVDGTPAKYGNGYNYIQFSSSNQEESILRIYPEMNLTGVHFDGNSAAKGFLLSSSQGPHAAEDGDGDAFTRASLTGTFRMVQDQRWLWYDLYTDEESTTFLGPTYDHGIGYGGGIGQLWAFSNKSIIGEKDENPATVRYQIGSRTIWSRATPEEWISSDSEKKSRTAVILWPAVESYNGVQIQHTSLSTTGSFKDGTLAASFGPTIDIEDYTNLNVQIIGSTGLVSQRIAKILIKFQFFDSEVGEAGFESILSSSVRGTGLSTSFLSEYRPHIYEFYVPFEIPEGTLANETFTLSFERELLKTTSMRIHLTMVTDGSSFGTNFNLLVKGVLSKEESGKDIIKFRTQ